jgi:ABC-type bacteriocin/lantibiotic exporter with double-glycine peptidase domain
MRLFLSCLSITLLFLTLGVLPGQDIPKEEGVFTCGLNAAYLFLNKTGHHAAYASLLEDFKKQNPPDSLLAIKNVLEKHGCATMGIKTDADYFLDNKGPAIVYLQLSGFGPRSENHFSLLVDANRQDGAKLLDPIFNVNSASFITWGTFSKSYQGMALILK